MCVVVYWNKIGCSDITPLDFFLWGYVKDIVYQTKVRDIADLKQRIRNAIATIDEPMLQWTWQEINYHLDVLHATNGAHIEVYLIELKNFNKHLLK